MRISGPAAVPAPPYQPLSEWVNASSLDLEVTTMMMRLGFVVGKIPKKSLIDQIVPPKKVDDNSGVDCWWGEKPEKDSWRLNWKTLNSIYEWRNTEIWGWRQKDSKPNWEFPKSVTKSWVEESEIRWWPYGAERCATTSQMVGGTFSEAWGVSRGTLG